MKNIIKYIFTLAFPALFLLGGCTDKMEDLNFDSKKVAKEDTYKRNFHLNGYVLGLENNINELTSSWKYQVQQNLNADVFSGYMMSANGFGMGGDNSNYNFVDGWNGWLYIVTNTTLSTILELESELETVPETGDYYGMALIMKVIQVQRMIDAFGPFPYKSFGAGIDQAWDDVPEIYDAFLAELDLAIDMLSGLIGTEFENRVAAEYDISTFGGNTVQWIKLANSVKLRIAMRMSDVAPAKARSIVEAVVANEYGCLNSESDIFEIKHSYSHPLSNVSQAWKDVQMSSNIESFLGGYNDPRISSYFAPAADAAVVGQYKGIRQGIVRDEKTTYQDYSLVNVETSTPVLIITASESYFLLAEAALRGWSVGGATAQELYEQGIRTSFNERKVGGIEDYLVSDATPQDYVDPKNADYNYTATTAVTPSWSSATTDEERLEKIITQKWIAIFPDGAEAWAEFRRTGYPKLVPVYSNQSVDIPQGEFLKRMPYPTAISSPSGTAYTNAINSFLGGEDNPYTPLWWDVN